VVLPNVGAEGILFYEKGSLENMIIAKKFPVRGDSNYFQLHVLEIIEIEKNVDQYVKQLSDLLKIEVNVSDDPKHLELLSRAINTFLTDNDKEGLFVPLGIFFHELLRKRIAGKWCLEKEYVLNPYYVPYVTDRENRAYRIWPTLVDYLQEKPFSSQKFFDEVSQPLN
jgi:hypothetical protein